MNQQKRERLIAKAAQTIITTMREYWEAQGNMEGVLGFDVDGIGEYFVPCVRLPRKRRRGHDRQGPSNSQLSAGRLRSGGESMMTALSFQPLFNAFRIVALQRRIEELEARLALQEASYSRQLDHLSRTYATLNDADLFKGTARQGSK